MKIYKILLFIISLSFSSAQAETLVFPKSGFTIDSLDSTPTTGMTQPLMMLLPAVNGFSANVNIQVQFFTDTMQQYKTLSEAQFEQMGLTIISMTEENNVLTIDYMGVMQGLNLHWYAKAFKKGDHVYLVTATGAQESWENVKQRLIANVNSFKLSH